MDPKKKALSDLIGFVSDSRWVIGKLAAETGMAFETIAASVGVPVETIKTAVQVHNAFGAGEGRKLYPGLNWIHFHWALHWDDCAECLQWAYENQATPNEMMAWRRAQHG